MGALLCLVCVFSTRGDVWAQDAGPALPPQEQPAAAVPTPAETARQAWESRVPGVPSARAAVAAVEAWATASSTAEAHSALSRASYWLGLQMAEDKLPSADVKRAYDQGVAAGQRAQKLNPKEPGAYFWEAVNRAKSAEIRGIMGSAGELPTLRRLMETVDKLEPGFFHGGTNRYWGAVITRTPEFLVRLNGQSLQDGEDYFKKALAVDPRFVGTRRFWAELKEKQGERAAGVALLKEALKTPASGDADLDAWNTLEKKFCRDLLKAWNVAP